MTALARWSTGGTFTISACKKNISTASVDTTDLQRQEDRIPLGGLVGRLFEKAKNVSVTRNIIDFNRASIMHCVRTTWPACGANGIFSEYGSPPNKEPGWIVATELTFWQNNKWSDNLYNGPSIFYGWNQGNGDNPVSWADWSGNTTNGDKCGSAEERQSGYCAGPFGEDIGSTYHGTSPPP